MGIPVALFPSQVDNVAAAFGKFRRQEAEQVFRRMWIRYEHIAVGMVIVMGKQILDLRRPFEVSGELWYPAHFGY